LSWALRSVTVPQSRVSRPRASGLQGRTPAPWSAQSGSISMHALDCALTDLQPGRAATVVVHAATQETCSTVVSKLGHWMPRGQALGCA
jgi:hypothetical protein